LADGLAWDAAALGQWVVGDDPATATLTVTLDAAETCELVVPEDPSVEQAVCVGGVVTEASVTAAEGPEGVTYVVSSFDELPAEVTVTATLADGLAWDAAALGQWVVGDDPATATLTVTLDAASCNPATPLDPIVVQATCTNGAVTLATVQPQETAGVDYTLDPIGDPAGSYDASVVSSVTVTATVQNGFGWADPLPIGWSPGGPPATTARFIVTLVPTTCAERIPAAPIVVDAICRGGVVTEPTLTLQATDGITYTTDIPAPYSPGDVVVVTATLAGTGVSWPAEGLSGGWTETSDTTATYTVEFADVACLPVTPVDPVVNPATCVSGVATAPTVELAITPGIEYSVDPPGPYDPAVATDVVVTATVLDGFAWADSDATPSGFAGIGLRPAQQGAPEPVPLPEGWTWVSPTAATFEITLEAFPPCPSIELEAPEVSQAECIDGEPTEPFVEPVETDGIEYAFDPAGPWDQGDSVAVTATITDPEAGWADPPADGWTVVDSTTATYEVTFEEIECEVATSTTSTTTAATTTTDAGAVSTTAPTPTSSAAVTTVTPSTTAGGTTAPTVAPTTTAAGATTAPAVAPTTSSVAVPPTSPAPTSAVAVLSGSAVCGVEDGTVTVTWTVTNTGGVAGSVTGRTRGPSFDPADVPAGGAATAVEVVAGTAEDAELFQSVTVEFADGEVVSLSATVTVPGCTGPAAPEGIVFTFSNDPDVSVAEVGQTVSYSYCGRNDSDVALEVLRVVDDRFGVLELPDVETVVEPGESFCNTDIPVPVTFIAQERDAGTTIVNNAVVTVRTVDGQTFQAADPAEVEILGFRSPAQEQPTTTGLPPTGLAASGASAMPAQLIAGLLALSSGSLVMVLARRRTTT
jgi:hypothetical protein